jgi:hypothetical protein
MGPDSSNSRSDCVSQADVDNGVSGCELGSVGCGVGAEWPVRVMALVGTIILRGSHYRHRLGLLDWVFNFFGRETGTRPRWCCRPTSRVRVVIGRGVPVCA